MNDPLFTIQEVVEEGLIHPSANESMTIRLSIPYLPAQYPPATLKARGYVCNCADFYDNPCRVEFRKVICQASCSAATVANCSSQASPLILDYCLHATLKEISIYGNRKVYEAGTMKGSCLAASD